MQKRERCFIEDTVGRKREEISRSDRKGESKSVIGANRAIKGKGFEGLKRSAKNIKSGKRKE